MDDRFDMLGFHDLKSQYASPPPVRDRSIAERDDDGPGELAPSERAVYRAYAVLKGSGIRPRSKELMRLTGLTRQTVETCMQKLRCCGLVTDRRVVGNVASEMHLAEPDDPPESESIRARAESMKVYPPPYPPSTWDDEERFRIEFTRQMLDDWGQFHPRNIPSRNHEWRKRLFLGDYRDL